MKKRQELEQKIQELQKELDLIKKEEEFLPESFSPELVLDVIDGDLDRLYGAFCWDTTPQGLDHWRFIAHGKTELTDKDIIQLQKWMIVSYRKDKS